MYSEQGVTPIKRRVQKGVAYAVAFAIGIGVIWQMLGAEGSAWEPGWFFWAGICTLAYVALEDIFSAADGGNKGVDCASK